MNASGNDNNTPGSIGNPDAHGQAALLLAESTLHVLVERGILNRADALDAIVSAMEITIEVAEESGESENRMRESLGLLNRIARSLEIESA